MHVMVELVVPCSQSKDHHLFLPGQLVVAVLWLWWSMQRLNDGLHLIKADLVFLLVLSGARFASLSASSFPRMPQCEGIRYSTRSSLVHLTACRASCRRASLFPAAASSTHRHSVWASWSVVVLMTFAAWTRASTSAL